MDGAEPGMQHSNLVCDLGEVAVPPRNVQSAQSLVRLRLTWNLNNYLSLPVSGHSRWDKRSFGCCLSRMGVFMPWIENASVGTRSVGPVSWLRLDKTSQCSWRSGPFLWIIQLLEFLAGRLVWGLRTGSSNLQVKFVDKSAQKTVSSF